MSRKMQCCLPVLLLTLCFLPMSASAQDTSRIPPQVASRLAMLKQKQDNALKTARSKDRKAKAKADDADSPFQVLHIFTAGADGDFPVGGVNPDTSGNVYGSTPGQGTTGDYGTLYKIDTAGNYTVLYDFQNGSDGSGPGAPPLPPDAFGNMYGTADSGAGASGTMFQFIPGTSAFNLLVAFGTPADPTAGYDPMGLISDSSGNLYGFTRFGGDFGNGNVYEAPSGDLTNPTNLYSFTGNSDGGVPFDGTLLVDASGNLYGTTAFGGNTYNGNVYKLSPPSGGGCPAGSYQNDSNWCEIVLYSFDAPTDPQLPFNGVAMDASGNLYGAGVSGGINYNGGVWKLTPVSSEPGGVCPAGSNQTAGSNWCETVLHYFQGGSDGSGPVAGVVLDSAGNLYGAAEQGGTDGYGTLYEISANGQFTVLYSFDGADDGGQPWGTPALSPSGYTLYGTAMGFGQNPAIYGTVWSYQLPQPQTITFTSVIPTEVKKGDTFTVSASATSGLPVALTASGVCSVAPNAVSPATYTMVTGSGTCTVIASQAGNNSYLPAPQISQNVQAVTKITQVPPTTSLTSTVSSAAYQSTFTVTATSNSNGALTITAAPVSVCSISGTTVTMNSGTGTCTVKAKWAATESFAAAEATPLNIAATPLTGTIEWTTPEAITYGTKLSATQLNATTNSNGKLVYTPKINTLLTVGSQSLSVTLDASKDYTGTTAIVNLTVNPIGTTITIPRATPNPAKVGQTVTVDFTVEEVGGTYKPTGTVTVSDSTNSYTCQGALTAGRGSCQLTFSSAGSIILTATYAGDNNNTTSTSGQYTETIN
jgi:uncharacterized repeat protein (TIGR03803 family)